MTNSGRFAARWAAIAFLVHTVAVVALSAVHNLLWGKVSFAWEAGHLLRVVDLPVYWAIDHRTRLIAQMPSWFASLGVHGTGLLVEGLSHAVIGGAFYAFFAAVLALIVHHHRQQRELAAPASSN